MIFFSHKFGQLGNRLFGFAHLIANAASNRATVVNLSFDEYAKYFESTSKDVLCRFPPANSFTPMEQLRRVLFFFNRGVLKLLRKSKLFKSKIHRIIIADLPEYQFGEDRYYQLDDDDFQQSVRRTPVVLLFGRFFRDYASFENHKDVIRDYFRPVRQVQTKVSRLLSVARQNSDLVIGVHMRRGDYAQFSHGRYFYSPEQYAEKMQALQTSIGTKRVTYIICSNEKISPDIFGSLKVVPANGGPVEDLYTLSGCDLIMGPPSTFSAWAAFYGDKPLCQIKDINKSLTIADFVKLPPTLLYNFLDSFGMDSEIVTT